MPSLGSASNARRPGQQKASCNRRCVSSEPVRKTAGVHAISSLPPPQDENAKERQKITVYPRAYMSMSAKTCKCVMQILVHPKASGDMQETQEGTHTKARSSLFRANIDAKQGSAGPRTFHKTALNNGKHAGQ